jgi:uncharacterized protein (TIGR03067 family)
MHWQLLTAVLIVAVPASAEDKPKDEEAIQGTWTVVSKEMGGKKTPDADLKALKVTIKDGTLTVDDGKKKDKLAYKLDPSKTPKAIDLTGDKGDGKMTTPAIYELDGDTLKICWSEKVPEDRPTELTGKADSGQTMMVLKREKKPAEKKDEEKIQGTWTVVSYEYGGKKDREDETKKVKLVFKDGSVTIDDPKREQKAKFKLDATKKPKEMDITPEDEGADVKVVQAIYELKDDELKICFVKRSDATRPTEFASKPDTELVLIVLKREKPKKDK